MRAHIPTKSIDPPRCRWLCATSGPLDQRWDAHTYVYALKEHGAWLSLGDLRGQIREGVRLGAAEAQALGLYGPSSINELRLEDEGLGALPQSWGDLATVGPGDVVVSKFLPVEAAWVSQATTRRPIDANCARVIGLEDETGFWVANVLQHPHYQQSLARRAAGSALPRLGLRDLRALRLPQPPTGLKSLVVDWSRASQDRADARWEILRLRAEVDSWVAANAPARPDLRTSRFHSAAEVGDSWAPAHAALHSFQADAGRRGWRPLGELLSEDTERLRGRRVAALRVLRLSNTNGLLGFALPELAELRHPSFRIYAHPLAPTEVLLSVLGSSPKVLLHHPTKDATVWVSDHWARCSVPRFTGALALVLESQAVSWQLSLATTGAARQFIARDDLARIRFPLPEPPSAERWHERIINALEELAEAAERLKVVRDEVRELIDECLGGSR